VPGAWLPGLPIAILAKRLRQDLVRFDLPVRAVIPGQAVLKVNAALCILLAGTWHCSRHRRLRSEQCA
jgi:hypothetical protein